MIKDELIVVVEELFEDSGIELDNDPKGKLLNTRSKQIISIIYDMRDDIDVTEEEIKEAILRELPKNITDDDDWIALISEIAENVVDLFDNTDIDDFDE